MSRKEFWNHTKHTVLPKMEIKLKALNLWYCKCLFLPQFCMHILGIIIKDCHCRHKILEQLSNLSKIKKYSILSNWDVQITHNEITYQQNLRYQDPYYSHSHLNSLLYDLLQTIYKKKENIMYLLIHWISQNKTTFLHLSSRFL